LGGLYYRVVIILFRNIPGHLRVYYKVVTGVFKGLYYKVIIKIFRGII